MLRRRPTSTVAIAPAPRLGDRNWEFRVQTRLDDEPAGVARVPLEA